MPLHICESTLNILQLNSSYTWTPDQIPYLGIKLTAKSNSLYAANYLPLLQQTQTELNNFRSTTLSPVGRISSFKMLVLPKILYLIRIVPINLPHHFLDNATLSLLDISGQVNTLDGHSPISPKQERWGVWAHLILNYIIKQSY